MGFCWGSFLFTSNEFSLIKNSCVEYNLKKYNLIKGRNRLFGKYCKYLIEQNYYDKANTLF